LLQFSFGIQNLQRETKFINESIPVSGEGAGDPTSFETVPTTFPLYVFPSSLTQRVGLVASANGDINVPDT